MELICSGDSPQYDPYEQRNLSKALQMIEVNGDKADFTYFNAKMLENWAGPVHWKFKAPKSKSRRYHHLTIFSSAHPKRKQGR